MSNSNQNATQRKKKIRYPKKDFSDVTNLIENVDYVVCRVCNHRGADIISHLRNIHNILSHEYRQKYEQDAEIKAQYLKDKLKGENNPAYQHGGKFSPFSDKFFKGNSKVEETKKKAKLNKQLLNKDSTKLEYWLEKTNGDEVEAKKLLSERQATFSLEKCVSKYGEEEGKKIWLDRQEKWQEKLNSKSLEEKERINKLKVGNGKSVSNAEYELIKIFEENGIKVDHQYTLMRESTKIYLYDFNYKNKLIEYNGDYWHCNPKKYDENFYNKTVKLHAHEIWKKDEAKINCAKENGYEILVIWELDYKNDKQGTIQKCLDFLTQ
jgi:hypothetical protein